MWNIRIKSLALIDPECPWVRCLSSEYIGVQPLSLTFSVSTVSRMRILMGCTSAASSSSRKGPSPPRDDPSSSARHPRTSSSRKPTLSASGLWRAAEGPISMRSATTGVEEEVRPGRWAGDRGLVGVVKPGTGGQGKARKGKDYLKAGL